MVEKCFWDIFVVFFVYFVSTIETLSWNWLVYMLTYYYIPDLVEKFYNGFAKFDILDDNKSFKLQ